jgi:hypothetical protein
MVVRPVARAPVCSALSGFAAGRFCHPYEICYSEVGA